jgi:hypothetical protein
MAPHDKPVGVVQTPARMRNGSQEGDKAGKDAEVDPLEGNTATKLDNVD